MSLISIILPLVLAFIVIRILRKPSSNVPGPWYTKWTGVILKYHWLTGTRPYYVHSLHQQYGPVVRIAPDYVDFCDIEAAKTIYSTKESFRKSPWYLDLVTARQQNIFSTNDIDVHRRYRRLLGGPMSESSLKTVIPLVNARVELAIERIHDEMRMRGAADLYKWWIFMATDVIGELTFGDSFRMLELGQKNDYIRNLENIASAAALRATFPSLARVAETVPMPIIDKAAVAALRLRGHAVESINRYRRLALDANRVQPTLFSKLFTAEEEDKLTSAEILSNSQSYIIAGSDTTASTLTFLVWSVCRNARIKAALVEELRTLPHDFDEPVLRRLPYLGQVIDETLRLYSAVSSGLPRVVPPEGAEIAGYWLSGGTTVCSQAYSMHRDPRVFPDPSVFNPSRWIFPTKAMKEAFMPFGKGARICLGLHLAMIELRLATARFFLEFPDAKMSNLDGMSDADMMPKMYFTSNPTGRRCLIQAR